jgi:hypothetical protein
MARKQRAVPKEHTMSTTTQASRSEDRPTTRIRTGILAVGAIIAIGVSILFLSVGSSHKIATPATPPQHTAIPPATHAVVTAPPPAGFFRDPATHALLRVPAAGCNGAQLRVEKVCARP